MLQGPKEGPQSIMGYAQAGAAVAEASYPGLPLIHHVTSGKLHNPTSVLLVCNVGEITGAPPTQGGSGN